MPTQEAIVLAIGTHLWWKNDFERAVSDGWHFLNPALAERSAESELGYWLAQLPAAEQASEHCGRVRARYADFHQAAAHVVRLASSGDIDQAEANLRSGGYADAATALTLALRDWMAAVKPPEYAPGLAAGPAAPPTANQELLRP